MSLNILRLLSLVVTLGRLRSELALENLALRQQLAILRRQQRRPKLRNPDRLFRLLLSRSWADWKEALPIVKSETVLHWHRKRFASHWTRMSQRSRPGRPGKDRAIHELIRRIANANILVVPTSAVGRTPEARNRCLGADRLPVDAETEETAFADLENIPRQQCRRPCVD